MEQSDLKNQLIEYLHQKSSFKLVEIWSIIVALLCVILVGKVIRGNNWLESKYQDSY